MTNHFVNKKEIEAKTTFALFQHEHPYWFERRDIGMLKIKNIFTILADHFKTILTGIFLTKNFNGEGRTKKGEFTSFHFLLLLPFFFFNTTVLLLCCLLLFSIILFNVHIYTTSFLF